MGTDIAPRSYRRRVVDDELDELVPRLPALALEGAKGVGKTRTALQRAGTSYDLDSPGVLQIATADPTRLLTGRAPILIDEWQRLPESWDVIRRAVDADPSGGRFLLTGSANPANPGTHSGAGRIVQLRMRPLSLFERGLACPSVSLAELLTGTRPPVAGTSAVDLAGYAGEICGSGLPALRGLTGRALRAQLDGYLARIVDRDFAELDHPVRNPVALRGWMRAYAAASSTSASYEAIRDAATPGQRDKPAKSSTMPYRDVLQRLWILDPVPAWLPTRNHFSKRAAAPKHQLADPALAASLLGVGAEALLGTSDAQPALGRDATLLGQLFESLVALDLRVYAQAAEAVVSHFRTYSGNREVDFIVERRDQRVVAVEVKLSATVNGEDVRHLNWLRDQLGADLLDAVVVTTGSEAYRRSDGIAVVPAALLGP